MHRFRDIFKNVFVIQQIFTCKQYGAHRPDSQQPNPSNDLSIDKHWPCSHPISLNVSIYLDPRATLVITGQNSPERGLHWASTGAGYPSQVWRRTWVDGWACSGRGSGQATRTARRASSIVCDTCARISSPRTPHPAMWNVNHISSSYSLTFAIAIVIILD